MISISSIPVINSFYNQFILSSILINEPLFIRNKSPFINKMNEKDFRISYYSAIQAAVQSEFYLSFKNKVILKSILRGFFIIKYIHCFFDYDSYYSSFYEEKFFYFIFSLCFVSSGIEFIGLYDYNNNLKVLQKDSATIIIKLIVEICLSLLLTEIHFYNDNMRIKKEVLKFSHLNPKSYNNKILKFLNELYYQQQPNLLKNIFLELNLEIEKRVHNPKCKQLKVNNGNCFYCHNYNSKNFSNQMNSFLNNINNNKFHHNCIKTYFPLLYSFLENEIEEYLNMNFNQKNILTYFLLIITFLFIFEKNYYKCIFLLEKIKDKPKIKKNTFVLLQIENLKEELLNIYNDELHNKSGNLQIITVKEEKENHSKIIKEYHNFYKSIDRLISLNDRYKSFIFNYIDSLRFFNDDIILFKKYVLKVKNFYDTYIILKNENELMLSQYKCKVSYPYYQYIIFYEYFFGEISKKKELLLQNFFSYQLTSLLKDPDEYFSLILTIEFTKSGLKYKIKYATTTLVHKLKYHNNEFKTLDAKNIFPKSFSKSYLYHFKKTLEEGNDFLKMNNFCLLDKENYIILFDVEGITIFKQNTIDFYLKLTEAKEQLLINKNSTTNTKKNNRKRGKRSKKINNNNYYGASFLFTNRNGKILNLSRGFEDFFFINSKILSKYQINVIDLFKIEKLQNKGSLTTNLNNVYESINDIYMREVGQLGEDPFSKIILPLNNLIDSLESSNTNFNLEIFYEQKQLIKDLNKIKYYYLFVTSIFEEESNELYINRNSMRSIIPQSTNNSQFSQFENSDNTFNSFIKTPQQENNTTIGNTHIFPFNDKIYNILNLAEIILHQFFHIKIPKTKNEKDELNQNEPEKFEINNNNNNNNNYHNNNHNNNINNNNNNDNHHRKNNEISDKDLILNRKKKNKKERIKRNNIILKFYPSFVSLLFGIIILYLFLFKIKKNKEIKNFLQESNNCLMLSQTIFQIILKIVSIQFIDNGLRDEIFNGTYNNSISFHNEKLTERLSDYLYFNSKFLIFFLPYVPKIGKSNLAFLNELNYSIPEKNGKKEYTLTENIFKDLNADLIYILNRSNIKITFNQSDYYYTSEFISISNYSETEYFMTAIERIKILESFYKNLIFEITEIINCFSKIIKDEVHIHYKYSLITMCLCILFSIFYIFQFFMFLQSTKLLFAKYFISHLQLRFFNIFLITKTAEILEFFENSTRMDYNRKLFEYIEIIDNNEESNIIKILLTERIYDFNMIKINPFNVRTLNYKGDPLSKLIGDDIIEKESIKSSLELSSFTKNVKKIIDSNKQKVDNLSKFKRRASLPKIHFSNRITSPSSSNKGNPILKSPRHLPRNLIVPSNFNKTNSNFNISLINNSSNNINILNNNNVNNNNVSGGNTPPIIQTINQTEQSLFSNNISLTKSTIPLNDTSNRRSSTNLKLLNQEKKPLRKNDTIKEDEETTLRFNQNGHKLMKMGIMNSTFLIQLITIIIIFIGLSIIQIILSIRDKNMYISILKTESSVYQNYNYITQFVLTYELSVLSNKEITVNFKGYDFSYPCDLIDKNVEEYNLFNCLKLCYPKILEEVNKVGSGNINKNLKLVRELRNNFLSENFCESLATFISNNTEYFPKLGYLSQESYLKTLNDCKSIGYNLNSKGLPTAIDSIYELITTYYNDFLSDTNKNEDSNFKRISDLNLYISEIEISKMIRKAALCYYVCFKYDFNKVQNVAIQNETITFIGLIILIVSICILFLIYINNLSKENDEIDFFYNIILNTILYKKQ